jgi:hypothetical protein
MSNVGKPIESHPSDHPSMGQAKVVKDFPDDGVLAADLSFPSGFWLVPHVRWDWSAGRAWLESLWMMSILLTKV